MKYRVVLAINAILITPIGYTVMVSPNARMVSQSIWQYGLRNIANSIIAIDCAEDEADRGCHFCLFILLCH